MIKANELRIGNWVYLTKDNFITVEDYQIEAYDIYKTDESDCYDIKPIPLTEKWLLKLGFTKTSHEPGYVMGDDFEKSEKCDEYNIGDVTIMNWEENVFILSNSFAFKLRVDIKYVHQLQNLYFALTNEELKINL